MNELFKHTEEPFEMVSIDDIKPEIDYPCDYCMIVVLKKDIEKNGMKEPLFVNRENQQILLGNQRYAVLKALNITGEIPVRYRE